MAKDLEREITEEQFDKIIHVAESLQHIQERNGELREAYQELIEPQKDMAPLTMGILYEVAGDLGIDESYLNQAIRLNYSSQMEQTKDLGMVGAVPHQDVMIRRGLRYTKDYIGLINNLRGSFPSQNFEVKDKIINFGVLRDFIRQMSTSFDQHETEHIMNFYKNNNKKLKLAKLFFKLDARGSNLRTDLNADLYSPIFLSGCGKEFKELNKGLDKMDVTYHYDPEGSE